MTALLLAGLLFTGLSLAGSAERRWVSWVVEDGRWIRMTDFLTKEACERSQREIVAKSIGVREAREAGRTVTMLCKPDSFKPTSR
jgi:hypothetical protein